MKQNVWYNYFFVSPSYEGEQFQESDYSKVIKG